MMPWLASLEGSAFSTWLRESNTIWAYPTVLTLHTAGMGILVGANAAVDLRLLGLGRQIPLASLTTAFRAMWIGFWINAITGVMLFAADATTKGATVLFMWKLAFIAVGVVLIVLLGRALYGRGVEAAAVTPAARMCAALSLLVWLAAITAGRLMAYPGFFSS